MIVAVAAAEFALCQGRQDSATAPHRRTARRCRGRPAVCIGVPPGAEAEPILGGLGAGSDQAQILRCAAPAVTAGCVVLRSFGAFDDAEVAAELFISEAEWRTVSG